MVRKRFPDTHCSVARALNDVGDWWSLLVVKEAMLGTRRFVDFQQNLGIARNILCDRLARLLENGVLIKQDVGEHGTRYEYRLTEKGRDLRQWSDRWNGESDGPELVDRANGEPVRTVTVQSSDGRALDVRSVVYRDSSETDSAAG
jgi:DNA-binding HxlR family transcriptional regulator